MPPKGQQKAEATQSATPTKNDNPVTTKKEPKVYQLVGTGMSLSRERKGENSHRTMKNLSLYHTSIVTEWSEKEKRYVEREIRYVPGESSIYVNEQSPTAAERAKNLRFAWGQLIVPGDDNNLMLFMDLRSENIGSKTRNGSASGVFFEVNPNIEIVKKNTSDVTIAKVINWLDDTFSEETGNSTLKMYARSLGVDIKAKDHVIMNNLMRMARENPKEFLDGFASTAYIRKYYIMTAEDNGIIKIDRQSGVISMNGNTILNVSPADDPIDYFVRFALDANGSKIYDTLKQRVDSNRLHSFVMGGDNNMESVLESTKLLVEKLTEIEEREYV